MKSAAPKFKGTMLMMNQGTSPVAPPKPAAGAGAVPSSSPNPAGPGSNPSPGIPGAGTGPVPSRLKGTIVGVAAPAAGAAPAPPAFDPTPAPAAFAPPAAEAPPEQHKFGGPGGANPLGATVAIDGAMAAAYGAAPGTGGAPPEPPPAFGAPPPDAGGGYGGGGGPPMGNPYGGPPMGGGPGADPFKPMDSGGMGMGSPNGGYGAPAGPPPGGAPYGAPPADYGQQQQPYGMGMPGPGAPMQQYGGAPMMQPGMGQMGPMGQMVPGAGGPPRSWMITLLLAIFGGYLGIHRFYTGHTLYGVLQLVTCGGFGVWQWIDIIFILMGKYTDAQGRPLVKDS